MVVQHHDVAPRIVGIHAAAGVGNDEQFDTERLHHAHGKRYLLERVAFVGVEAAFHRHDGQATQAAADQVPDVADRGGDWKMRNFAERETGLLLDFASHATQAGPQDDAGPSVLGPAPADHADRFGDSVGQCAHRLNRPRTNLPNRRSLRGLPA